MGAGGMHVQRSPIVELEGSIKGGSQEGRVETVRRVTDLFLNVADRLSEAQIAVFTTYWFTSSKGL
jgi:hypothetical protein